MIKTAIMLFVISVVIALFVVAALIVYSCCVVAGRADETIRRIDKEENRHEKL